MTNDLIPDPGFDFSKYRPGDVLIFDDAKIKSMRDAAEFAALHDALCQAARRAGLDFVSTFDPIRREARLEFREPERKP